MTDNRDICFHCHHRDGKAPLSHRNFFAQALATFPGKTSDVDHLACHAAVYDKIRTGDEGRFRRNEE